MKLYRGKKRIAEKMNTDLKRDWYVDTLRYILSCKPGDVVHTCVGFNTYVSKLEVWWLKWKRTAVITEVRVTGSDGCWHYFPGGGCVSLPETVDSINEWVLSWGCEEGQETLGKWGDNMLGELPKKIEKLKVGSPIVNDDGVELEYATKPVKIERVDIVTDARKYLGR